MDYNIKRNNHVTYYMCSRHSCSQCPLKDFGNKNGMEHCVGVKRDEHKYDEVFRDFEKAIIEEYGLANYINFIRTDGHGVGEYMPKLEVEL